MTVTDQMDQKYQEDIQRLRGLCLFDDDFFTKCFEDETESIELVLRILLSDPDLKVLDVRTQVTVKSLMNRSVRLDILATDSAGRKMNVEIQRADKGAGRKRARFYSSVMDANLLEKGGKFEELPETWVIFITENDVMGKGLPLYPVERCLIGTGERFEDGSHILYVNGAYRGDTPIGKLMHDFSCADAADMYYKTLADRVRFFKENEEGIAIMCRAMEDMRNQAAMERVKTVVYRMLAAGKYSLEEIADITELSLDEVKELQTGRSA